MAKRAPKATKNQEKIVGIFSGLNAESIQDLFEERAAKAAFALGVELLEQDVERLCGARYSRGEQYSRYGTERTSIVIGGARYGVERPRIRGEGGEVYPPTLKKLREQDLLDEEMKERMLVGVSSRNYERVIEGYSNKIGVSRSSVSRAFKRSSQKDLDSINQADLSKYSFVGLVIDGIEIAGRTVVAAIGITSELEKVPVGLHEGDTENTEVVKDLLTALSDRHFTLHCKHLLCALDGGKALRKAVRSVFGDAAIVQRCWLHKLRNIQSYLPKAHHSTLLWRMKKMMGVNEYTDAKREMATLRKWLEDISYDAAQSLNEAGEELLTLHKLGITGELRKSLSSTNIIESLFSVVRRKLFNVKNWKATKGQSRLRWVASAICNHQKNKMRKLRGIKQKLRLIDALGPLVDQESISA